MGGGFIGGDGSIQWDFQGDNVISQSCTEPGLKKSRHIGRDRTNSGDKFFSVTIRLPVDAGQRDDFLESLATGLAAGKVGSPVTFKLRIEDKTNNGPISN